MKTKQNENLVNNHKPWCWSALLFHNTDIRLSYMADSSTSLRRSLEQPQGPVVGMEGSRSPA